MGVKISLDKVVDIYSSLRGGEISSEDRVFCKTAAGLIERWLDPKKSIADFQYEVCYAAATMANYRRALNENTSLADFKAGDITVNDKSEKAIENAHKLYEDAMASIGHLLKPKTFAFVSVRGEAF